MAERHRVRNNRSIWRWNKVVEGQGRIREQNGRQERMRGVTLHHGGRRRKALFRSIS
jgi:hypothetical protein